MSKINHYIHAATRENTRRSYQSAIEHYEATWGGFLPATADNIALYLSENAETLSINTLKQRIAALAQWHIDQGFPDPTKASIVKKVMKGIKILHPAHEKQARPLQLDQLSKVISAIDLTIQEASKDNDQNTILRQLRNKALILLGFWRGFRSDELSRLQAEYIQTIPGEGITIFLPRTKSDHQNNGQAFKAPALSRLCLVTAYTDWILAAQITKGPVFRGINRWGRLSESALNSSSIITLMRKIFEDAGLDDSGSYSSHSLRRGFATWASNNKWDIKSLMEYVGWKDIKSAMRYIDSNSQEAKQRIELGFL